MQEQVVQLSLFLLLQVMELLEVEEWMDKRLDEGLENQLKEWVDKVLEEQPVAVVTDFQNLETFRKTNCLRWFWRDRPPIWERPVHEQVVMLLLFVFL